MRIGIDASRAFMRQRTGVEEYAYQLVCRWRDILKQGEVILYLRPGQEERLREIDFSLPSNWRIKTIRFRYLWTQLGLSWEMLVRPVDVLFVPAHTVPAVHPRNTVVTIHGLEYEFCPQAYAWWERSYMRQSIRSSCRWASRIIAVSENSKRDLIRLYGIPAEKIRVIYEGCACQDYQDSPEAEPGVNKFNYPFLLFVGRLETRKNIKGIIRAFEILKEKYHIPQWLLLIGRSGYGYREIRKSIQESKFSKEIIEFGYASESGKMAILKRADVFLFPTLYEGFGLPVLEAQCAGVPVVTSRGSSLVEIADQSALLVDPYDPVEIAEAAYRVLSDPALKNDIINQGRLNAERFSWEDTARATADFLQLSQ